MIPENAGAARQAARDHAVQTAHNLDAIADDLRLYAGHLDGNSALTCDPIDHLREQRLALRKALLVLDHMLGDA